MFDTPFLAFEPGEGRLNLRGVSILVDADDYEGIQIAVRNLATDFEKVTGQRTEVWDGVGDRPCTGGLILVGSVERCRYLQTLASSGSDFGGIQGTWESFEISLRDCPWPWAERMLVIAGSDKRGAIFGAYTIAEQMGVSPWYWWADVPVQTHEHVYALPVTVRQGSPSVQYRGIFINDEAPALCDWVKMKFGPVFNSEFYKHVYELLLRMKANFLWPAMWSGFPEPGRSFFTDDLLNHETADRYGIVISTSHHEPMQRAAAEWHTTGKGPWSWDHNKEYITDHFTLGAKRSEPLESILTLGMRGESDGEIRAQDPKVALKDVIQTQRDIIQNVWGSQQGVKQVMTLYKEVLAYYEDGLEIPGDVTLIFPDDNFGNMRRLPTSKERSRPGGVGIYYHLEYVGEPRSYKWIDTNSCGKIQHQLRSVYDSGARKLWIINVGDIKPLELPLTFAMSLAWNIDCVTPSTIPKFFEAYAEREFGTKPARETSQLLMGHDRLMALRRYEHIESDTLSLLNYREAETVLERFIGIEDRAATLFATLPTTHKAAFFQLVLHPIKASRIFVELQITLAKNKLYGQQRRNTTNRLAQRVLELFDLDWTFAEEFHNSPWFGNKWKHIMKQPHYGFASRSEYHTPSRDMITGLSFVQLRQDSTPIAGQMGVAVEGHIGILPGLVNEECCRMQPSRHGRALGLSLAPLAPYGASSAYFEIFAQGSRDVSWVVSAAQPWILFSQSTGTLSCNDAKDQRVELWVDWDQVPRDFDAMVHIDIQSSRGEVEQIHLPVVNKHPPEGFSGFVESAGVVSIDVGRFHLTGKHLTTYQQLLYIGRTCSGGVSLLDGEATDIPYLEYASFLFSTPANVTISLYFTMCLDTNPEQPKTYDICFDGYEHCAVRLIETQPGQDLPRGWSTAVQDGVWIRKHAFSLIGSGSHLIKYRPLTSDLVLEKIVLDVGGLRESYLGPPQSGYIGRSS